MPSGLGFRVGVRFHRVADWYVCAAQSTCILQAQEARDVRAERDGLREALAFALLVVDDGTRGRLMQRAAAAGQAVVVRRCLVAGVGGYLDAVFFDDATEEEVCAHVEDEPGPSPPIPGLRKSWYLRGCDAVWGNNLSSYS